MEKYGFFKTFKDVIKMAFYVKRATGRARCQICKQKIKKGNLIIGFKNRMGSICRNNQCHKSCLTEKTINKFKVINKLIEGD